MHNAVVMDEDKALEDAANYGTRLKVCELSFFFLVDLFD